METLKNYKAPAIIDRTADLDRAVGRIMRSKINDFGQGPYPIDYILVSKWVEQDFILKCKNLIKEAFYDNKKCHSKLFPAIDNLQSFYRLKYLFKDAIHKGSICEWGGVFKTKSRRIYPTILTHVPLDAEIMQEQIFGPIIPVFTYSTREEALSFMRKFSAPRTYHLFSQSHDNINYLFETINTGGIIVNDLLTCSFSDEQLSLKYLLEIS